MKDLDAFTRAYLECALWSSTDDETPLDRDYGIEDFDPQSLAQCVRECATFQAANTAALEVREPNQGGHDFWLTRNHHGAGFWDGDWPEPEAGQLDRASMAAGQRDLYVGDDGRIYLSPLEG